MIPSLTKKPLSTPAASGPRSGPAIPLSSSSHPTADEGAGRSAALRFATSQAAALAEGGDEERALTLLFDILTEATAPGYDDKSGLPLAVLRHVLALDGGVTDAACIAQAWFLRASEQLAAGDVDGFVDAVLSGTTALTRRLGPGSSEVTQLLTWGAELATCHGHPDVATELAEQAFKNERWRERRALREDPEEALITLLPVAWRSRLAAADLAGAVPLMREYIGLHRRRRDPRGVASGLLMLAECQVSCGEARDAAGTCLSVLEVAAVLDDAEIRARALTLLGMAKHADGQLAQALRAFADAIATYEVAGDEGPDTVELLEAWARCLVDDGQEGAAAATREVAAERRRRLDGVA